MKLIKRLIQLILILVVLALAVVFIFAKSISYEVLATDLPQDVYEAQGNLQDLISNRLVSIFNPLSTDDDYTLTEEIVNLVILDAIHTNINAEYNPLSEDPTDATQYVILQQGLYVDFVFAKLNEDNQLVLTVSGGFDTLNLLDTAIIMTFDIEFDLINFSIVLTLVDVNLGPMDVTFEQLDWILSYADKNAIEDSVTTGTLNLDDYTYTISLVD